MSDLQLIIFALASVTILLVWLAIGVIEILQRRSQAQDDKFNDNAEQNIPFST